MSRVFRARRRIRLSDADAAGRLRLDAVARWLQDVAADDVEDAGWRSEEHVWVVRRTRLEVVEPIRGDGFVELATWCGGTAGSAAERLTTLAGDDGGRIEAAALWIHLDREGRPLRLSERFFAVYGATAAGRRAQTRLELPDPPADAGRRPWQLRAADVDQLGHVNNAAYWAAVEEVAPGSRRVTLEYRRPLDLGDRVELLVAPHGAGVLIGYAASGDVRAVAAAA